MTYYVFIENETISGSGQCPCVNEEIENIEVTKEIYDNIDHYIYEDGEIILDPDYEEKQAQKERARLDALTLTRGDVFMGLIQARMIDENVLKAQLEELPEDTDEEKKLKMLSINALTNALNFHRGHTLVNTIGTQLGISSENLDNFFETGDYHYLEPAEE